GLFHVGRDLQPVPRALHRRLRVEVRGHQRRPALHGQRDRIVPGAGGEPAAGEHRQLARGVHRRRDRERRGRRGGAVRGQAAARSGAARGAAGDADDACHRVMDARAAALRLRDAYAARQPAPTPSSEDPAFDLAAAYAVERELVRMRRERGHRTGGRKVGYANKAMWRVLKLDTLVWAHMYDDTVHYAARGTATLSIAPMYS